MRYRCWSAPVSHNRDDQRHASPTECMRSCTRFRDVSCASYFPRLVRHVRSIAHTPSIIGGAMRPVLAASYAEIRPRISARLSRKV